MASLDFLQVVMTVLNALHVSVVIAMEKDDSSLYDTKERYDTNISHPLSFPTGLKIDTKVDFYNVSTSQRSNGVSLGTDIHVWYSFVVGNFIIVLFGMCGFIAYCLLCNRNLPHVQDMNGRRTGVLHQTTTHRRLSPHSSNLQRVNTNV